MSMRMTFAVLLAACGSTESAPPSTTTTAGEPSPPTEAPAASVLAPALLRTVCELPPCGGQSPVVTVWRDASGAIARLSRLYGECDHNAALYVSPDGVVLDTIAEEPVMAGSPEAEAARARVERWTVGLTATDRIRCRDGARLPP